jgi:hypothetical protein
MHSILRTTCRNSRFDPAGCALEGIRGKQDRLLKRLTFPPIAKNAMDGAPDPGYGLFEYALSECADEASGE